MSVILVSTVLVAVMGVSLGLVIGATAKAFEVKTDPRIGELSAMLPGANCGACGFAGCADFAKNLVAGDTEDVSKCPVCPPAARSVIASFLGLASVGESEKKTAVVLCGGGADKAVRSAFYNGVSDCRSAALVAGGAKGCRFGCLGLGTCARICPFGAIEISPDGLAYVHPELCVACGKCVDACPRSIIKIVPEKVKMHVFCSSTEKGPAKKKVCSVACIGCRKCAKAAGEDKIIMTGFLARVNYDNPPANFAEIVEKAACPTGCIGLVDAREREISGKARVSA